MENNQIEEFSTNEEDTCIQSTIAPTEDNFQDTFLFDFVESDLIEKRSFQNDNIFERKMSKKFLNKIIQKSIKSEYNQNQKKPTGIKKVKK